MLVKNNLTSLYKLEIINHLRDKGFVFDKNLIFDDDLIDGKEFIAWSLYSDYTEDMYNASLESIKNTLSYWLEDHKDLQYSHFNVRLPDYFINKDNQDKLFRTVIIFKKA